MHKRLKIMGVSDFKIFVPGPRPPISSPEHMYQFVSLKEMQQLLADVECFQEVTSMNSSTVNVSRFKSRQTFADGTE